MRTDARPVIVFDLMMAKPVWHLPRHADTNWALCIPPLRDSPTGPTVMRRDHAKKIGRMCDRCAKMEP